MLFSKEVRSTLILPVNCILKCTKPAAGMQGECQERQGQISHSALWH
jgi:hypothetical protein